MSSRYVGPKLPGKAGFVQKAMDFVISKIPKKKKVSKDIKDFKPGTEFKGTPKYIKEMIKARSEVQKKFKPINEGIANETRQLRQTLQGMRGERITQSGISKGKNVSPGIYSPKKKIENKAKGGRVGYKRGTGLMKKKSDIQKIKETFSPKNKSTKFGMLSVKAGIDKNPNPTQADRIAGAKMKNKNKRFV